MAAAPQGNGADRPKIARVAKGKRPQYFSDPAIDKLLNMVLALTAELSVTRDRLDSVERLLEQHGVMTVDEIEGYRGDQAVEGVRTQRRMEMIARVMRILEKELEETTGKDMPASQDDVFKAVT